MAWKGFIKESKLYMSYPRGDSGRFAKWNHISVFEEGWTAKERRTAEVKFWRGFPRAATIFYFLAFKDFARKIYNNLIQWTLEKTRH